MADGEIKSCLVLCSNLMVSLPDNADGRAGARRARPAGGDRLLPVRDGRAGRRGPARRRLVRGRGHDHEPRRPGGQDQRRPPSRPARRGRDWEILSDLARRLGRGQFFPYTDAARDLRRAAAWPHAAASSDYYGITWEKIDAQDGVFWPCPTEDHPGTPRLFTERFGHPDGKAQLFAIRYEPPAEEPSDDYPFRLTTGRVVYHYLSGTQTRRLGFLNCQAPEPWVEIHPMVAERLGIRDRRAASASGPPRGAMELKALVVPTIRPDTLFIPFHYGHARRRQPADQPGRRPGRARFPSTRCAPRPSSGSTRRPATAPASPRAELHARSPIRRCSRTPLARPSTPASQEAQAVTEQERCDGDQDAVRRSVALHRLPRLRGGLPRVRLAQGREHGDGRLRRPRLERRDPADRLHALRRPGRRRAPRSARCWRS